MNSLDLATHIKDTPARLLDVRSASEFENAHIAGAYNVPLDQLGEHVQELRAARGPVVLICQSGQRAHRAEALLQGAGMANIDVLDGGMAAWQSSRLPVRRVRARVSLERQVRMIAGGIAAIGGFGAMFISTWFAVLPAMIGSGLAFAGATDTCAMGLLLARLPYNRSAVSCDTDAIVRQFLAHEGGQG
ncbi:MAG: rhodanese-like domain-containing protein [Vicinamibacterales bacterium]